MVNGIRSACGWNLCNRRICEHVGRDARNLQIGHAYLLDGGKPVTELARLAHIIQDDILPFLEEYCYEDYDALEKILGQALVDGQISVCAMISSSPADKMISLPLCSRPILPSALHSAAVAADAVAVENESADNGGE